MSLTFLFWLAATFLALDACIFIYVCLQAAAGKCFGATPVEISVGIGPVLTRRQWNELSILLKPIPLSGYTRFYGREDQDVESTLDCIDEESSSVPWPDVPALGRIVTLLVGPGSMIVLGMLFLAAPVVLQRPQLFRDPAAASDFQWSAIPGLRTSDQAATLSMQVSLIDQTALEFVRNLCSLRWGALHGWGGTLGTFVTTASTASDDFGHWFSCLGVAFCVMGVGNLMPLPILNGGLVMIALIESARGRKLSERAYTVLGIAALLFVLVCMLILIVQDIRWLVAIPT